MKLVSSEDLEVLAAFVPVHAAFVPVVGVLRVLDVVEDDAVHAVRFAVVDDVAELRRRLGGAPPSAAAPLGVVDVLRGIKVS